MFRRYNPTQGHWISPDPAGTAALDLANPQTWNRYAYVVDEPYIIVNLEEACRQQQWRSLVRKYFAGPQASGEGVL